jgi:predicted amidohydrolase YtcJ
MNDRAMLRAEIVGAVAAVRWGDQDHAAHLLSKLTGGTPVAMRESVSELVAANVEMVHAAVNGEGGGDEDRDLAFAVNGQDAEGRPLPIDDFEPAQRAATRIMLAVANDCPDDAEMQLDIVQAAPRYNEMGLVFVHTMCWTLDLLDLCKRLDRGVPEWLRPVLA